jgi:glucose-6-phosphate 1-epimerase
MDIDKLTELFAIPGQVSFSEIATGIPIIHVSTEWASAEVSLYGGQVLSYQPADDTEVLFLSRAAKFQQGTAIRGGVPICWPWFGAAPAGVKGPAHGFVRTALWQLKSCAQSADEIKLQMALSSTPTYLELWPHEFDLLLEVRIGKSLKMSLTTTNKDKQPITITQAMHSYFLLPNISELAIEGLAHCSYLDKLQDYAAAKQEGTVKITAETDRIYQGVPAQLELITQNRSLELIARNSQTAVVWNPWKDKSQSMTDLEDEDYLRFACVETANAGDEQIEIRSGESFTLGFELKSKRLN